jgi:hypothetical protein
MALRLRPLQNRTKQASLQPVTANRGTTLTLSLLREETAACDL